MLTKIIIYCNNLILNTFLRHHSFSYHETTRVLLTAMASYDLYKAMAYAYWVILNALRMGCTFYLYFTYFHSKKELNGLTLYYPIVQCRAEKCSTAQ